MSERHPRCTVEKMCSTLDERVDGVNENRKGLSLMVTTNARTGQNTRIGVVYKTSAKDRGLIINHCPFCGFCFDAWIDRAIELGAVKPRAEWGESAGQTTHETSDDRELPEGTATAPQSGKASP